MSNITLLDHPVLKHKLAILRDKTTSSATFRVVMKDISSFLAYEATKDLKTKKIEVATPYMKTTVEHIDESPVIVSILRAGNGMMEGLLSSLPMACAGHIGIYRDKFTKNTVEYYFKLPENIKDRTILLLDPIVATGDTMLACLDRLKQYGVGKVKLLTICISSEGAQKLHHFHKDLQIYALSEEAELDGEGHCLPGIGDAGNRLYQNS